MQGGVCYDISLYARLSVYHTHGLSSKVLNTSVQSNVLTRVAHHTHFLAANSVSMSPRSETLDTDEIWNQDVAMSLTEERAAA